MRCSDRSKLSKRRERRERERTYMYTGIGGKKDTNTIGIHHVAVKGAEDLHWAREEKSRYDS